MRSWLAHAALMLLLVVCFCGPAFEFVDEWDNFAATGNDLVLGVLAPAIWFGLGVLIGCLFTLVARPLLRTGMLRCCLQWAHICVTLPHRP